jgi:ketosteroid isomerase-like protein
MTDFETRLRAAYDAWHESGGRTPERFFDLYADDIELHSILEASLADALSGAFVGKTQALVYYTAIAEAWEMIGGRTDDVVARADKVVWIGHSAWRNRRTLRTVSGPKIDVWTLRGDRAVHFLELFDSYGCARAAGLVDLPN